MRKLTNARLVSRRLIDEWKLLSSVFIGILVAVTISVGSTVYLTALEQLAFKVSLNQITAPLLNLSVYAKRIPLTSEAVDNLDNLVTSIATAHIEDLYAGHEMYLRGTSSIVGTEEMPLPDVVDADSLPQEEARPIVWDGVLPHAHQHGAPCGLLGRACRKRCSHRGRRNHYGRGYDIGTGGR